jgi:hypothetical protein
MTDWIEQHDGGPQPVADDVWVQWLDYDEDPDGAAVCPAQYARWAKKGYHRIINQHLIEAARLEGIRLGLEAAAREASEWAFCEYHYIEDAIRALDPAIIAREAVLDNLASDAQEQGMGYEREADQ